MREEVLSEPRCGANQNTSKLLFHQPKHIFCEQTLTLWLATLENCQVSELHSPLLVERYERMQCKLVFGASAIQF